MKTWLLFLFFLMAASSALAEEIYQGIYQVTPHFKGHSKEYAEIKPFYEDTLTQVRELDKAFPRTDPPGDRQILGIDTFDLNDDGTKEIFVFVEDRSICGASNCPLDIYQRNAEGRLERLFNVYSVGGTLILASTTHGYHDLAFYKWAYAIWRFDGMHYQLSEHVSADRVIDPWRK